MFADDAIVASKILGITLTSRDKGKENQVPLCGFPFHSANAYIAKLIRAGHKVSICEQMEDPRAVKGIVRREVVRVITPGTLLEEALLNEGENNYIVSLSIGPEIFGLAFSDLSTGYFSLAQFEKDGAWFHLENELVRLAPKEVLLPESQLEKMRSFFENLPVKFQINSREDSCFGKDRAYRFLLDHFKVHSLEGYGCQDQTWGISAAGGLFQYIQETRLPSLQHLQGLRVYRANHYMVLDYLTQRNLELTRGIMDGQKEHSLLGILDKTLTPMGARVLRNWIMQPLLDLGEIERRQNTLQEFVESLSLRNGVRRHLKGISDVERLISRISLELGHARDLEGLKNSLKNLPELYRTLQAMETPLARSILKEWDGLEDVVLTIEKAIQDTPPISLKEGGIIRDRYHPPLDELRTICREGKGWIAGVEREERKRTGIDSLKIRYNQVFGYYIEVTKSHLSKVPSDFIRKQTLVNAERFITPRLKELESKVLGAEERIRTLEYELFQEIRKKVSKETSRIQAMAHSIAQIDVLCALAEVAVRFHYVRPQVTQSRELEICDGRHPVLEQFIPDRGFVPNDTLLNCQDHQLLIITGPNMAGKSTFMRQTALIVLMAQMGGFVPAKSARIGMVDRIFTRVGASDNLIAGQSTFMTEMNETANILHNATDQSLILLDEIGRGTSTFDGLSIAWAVSEYILDHQRVGARTLFATHYHELMELAHTKKGVQNYTSLVRESNDEIVFLRKIQPGGTDRSYGIQVARLAGLPLEVIQRSKEILVNLEQGEMRFAERFRSTLADGNQEKPNLLQAHPHPLSENFNSALFLPLVQELQGIDVLRMTPIQALAKIDELKQISDKIPPFPQKEVS